MIRLAVVMRLSLTIRAGHQAAGQRGPVVEGCAGHHRPRCRSRRVGGWQRPDRWAAVRAPGPADGAGSPAGAAVLLPGGSEPCRVEVVHRSPVRCRPVIVWPVVGRLVVLVGCRLMSCRRPPGRAGLTYRRGVPVRQLPPGIRAGRCRHHGRPNAGVQPAVRRGIQFLLMCTGKTTGRERTTGERSQAGCQLPAHGVARDAVVPRGGGRSGRPAGCLRGRRGRPERARPRPGRLRPG